MRRALVPIALFFGLTVGGCGDSAQTSAQRALTASARAVSVVDAHSARAYAQAAERAIESVETVAEYRDAMGAWDSLEQGLRIARAALYASQAALDSWVDGSEADDFMAALPCLTVSLAALVGLLLEVDIPIPDALRDAVVLVESIAGSSCDV